MLDEEWAACRCRAQGHADLMSRSCRAASKALIEARLTRFLALDPPGSFMDRQEAEFQFNRDVFNIVADDIAGHP